MRTNRILEPGMYLLGLATFVGLLMALSASIH